MVQDGDDTGGNLINLEKGNPWNRQSLSWTWEDRWESFQAAKPVSFTETLEGKKIQTPKRGADCLGLWKMALEALLR